MHRKVGHLTVEQKIWLERSLKQFEIKQRFYTRCLHAIYDLMSRELPITYEAISQVVGCMDSTVSARFRHDKKIQKILMDYARLHISKCVEHERTVISERLKKRYKNSGHNFDSALVELPA